MTFTAGFKQQEGIADKKMKLSRALEKDESVSLYFFKSDISKNYTKEITIVKDNSIQISIPE